MGAKILDKKNKARFGKKNGRRRLPSFQLKGNRVERIPEICPLQPSPISASGTPEIIAVGFGEVGKRLPGAQLLHKESGAGEQRCIVFGGRTRELDQPEMNLLLDLGDRDRMGNERKRDLAADKFRFGFPTIRPNGFGVCS